MNTVAIPIETKVREFDGKLWLGLNLVSRGYRVILGPNSEVSSTFDITEPDIYFTKDPGDTNIDTFKRLQSAGISVCGIDTEGAVFQSIDQFTYNKKNLLNYIDALFLWGEKLKDELEKYYNDINNLYVSGNPRFDLLQPHLRFIYEQRARSYNESYGDYILITCNFGSANTINPGGVDSEGTYEKDRKSYTHTNRIFHLFIEAMYFLQKEFPNTNIIIRPHPSENSSTYENTFAGYDHVHVEDSGDARAWIAGASVLIHHTSTTGIESALMGIPVISYRPVQNENYESELPMVASEQASSREQLNKYVTQYHKQNQLYELSTEQESYLKKYFYNIDMCTVEVICDVIDSLKISNKQQYQTLKPKTKGRIERRVKASSWATQVVGLYDMFQRLNGNKVTRDRRRYTRQKFPGLKQEEIIDQVKEFESVLELGSVSIEKVPLTNDTFMLQ